MDVNSYMIFLLISCRMAALVFFSPIFGRRNIPAAAKVGLSLWIAFFALHDLQYIEVIDYTSLELILSMLKEFAVGFAMGAVVQMFFAIFYMGGELIDLQMGLSMALMYDPTSNTQVSISGNLIVAMYTMLFFITNSHLNLFAIAIKSYNVVPIGFEAINAKVGIYFAELFGYILIYAVQLALPVIITEIIVEVAVGILMRVVPNINVFVINLQLKIIVGLIVIMTIIPVIVRFLEKINNLMMGHVSEVLMTFV
ncbi:MAG: flagellar biosynthetic protein FliR [Eubacteriales bacterium]|nr:flagellar biosynthetic protein FliR [Eubacteriales bacterium]MDD4390118.1 flagellar biosynthetic protein FliR [Eubacteriales bacterium]